MPKKSKVKSAIDIKRMVKPGMHSAGGVDGLYLRIQQTGNKSWILRVVIGGKRRDIGLGGYPAVGLKQSRDIAKEYREQIRQGVDPVDEKKAAQLALRDSKRMHLTFKQAAERCHSKKSDEFKNEKHSQQWINTLVSYAYPVIGDMPVKDIEQSHIMDILTPIWSDKTETATRLRQRIESVLSWATISGYRSGDNPARWSGHLDALLPKPTKLKKVQHHKALPWQEIGVFMTRLRQGNGIAAMALEFLILTATRSSEVRFAVWGEIDIAGRVWVIPQERTKTGKEQRVPLSPAAVDLLQRLPRFDGSDYIFPSKKTGKPLSDTGLSKPLKTLSVDAVPHGFRSTFRDWASENTNYPREVCEMALGHTIGNAVEAAYRRGDLFEKRAHLMTAWASYCEIVKSDHEETKIVSIRKKA